MKDLGYMNGWSHTIVDDCVEFPDKQEYNDCMKQKHRLEERDLNGRGTDTEYVCPICQIKWRVDSSD